MTQGFAAGLSEHPDAPVAVGEVVGQVIEGLTGPGSAEARAASQSGEAEARAASQSGEADAPPPPDLALLFVTPHHLDALPDAVATVRATLRPRSLLGCAAVAIVGGSREVEQTPAISLWAGSTGHLDPFHLTVSDTPDGQSFIGWPDDIPDDASALLLLADPFSFPVDALLERLADDRPGLPVVGGLASAARQPGGNRLVINDRVITDGAVGAFLGPGVRTSTVVSQGCRPVGNPFVVTKAENNVVYELAGRSALDRLQEVAGTLSEDDRRLMSELVQVGVVIDESKVEFGRGDFLVKNVIGADPETGAIAVGAVVEVGSTTQFQVRDARSADEDLRQLVSGHAADGALLFTCNGRGIRLFGEADHDASVVSKTLAGVPIAGMFCAGELGPIGGRNFVHGFTASVVLLSVDEASTPT